MLDIDDEDHNFFFVASSSGQKANHEAMHFLAREKNKTLGSPCIAHRQINKETDRQNEIQYALSSLSGFIIERMKKRMCAALSLSLYPKHGHGIHSRSICIHRRRRYRCRCRFD